jgi:hypothetical protein
MAIYDHSIGRVRPQDGESALVDRRLFLATGSAAAVFGALHTAKAETADADLFTLAKRVKALGLECEAAETAFADLGDQFEPPPPPECLLIREGDEAFAGAKDGEFAKHIGERFSVHQMKVLRSMRSVYQLLLSSTEPDSVTNRRATHGLARVTEIDVAAGRYIDDIEAARAAAGLRSAEAKAEALDDELKAAWRVLAFTPARTVEGALAKMDAVAHCFSRLNPEAYPDECSADNVLHMAVVELAELRKATEA